jgi:hypothetical protein
MADGGWQRVDKLLSDQGWLSVENVRFTGNRNPDGSGCAVVRHPPSAIRHQ